MQLRKSDSGELLRNVDGKLADTCSDPEPFPEISNCHSLRYAREFNGASRVCWEGEGAFHRTVYSTNPSGYGEFLTTALSPSNMPCCSLTCSQPGWSYSLDTSWFEFHFNTCLMRAWLYNWDVAVEEVEDCTDCHTFHWIRTRYTVGGLYKTTQADYGSCLIPLDGQDGCYDAQKQMTDKASGWQYTVFNNCEEVDRFGGGRLCQSIPLVVKTSNTEVVFCGGCFSDYDETEDAAWFSDSDNKCTNMFSQCT